MIQYCRYINSKKIDLSREIMDNLLLAFPMDQKLLIFSKGAFKLNKRLFKRKQFLKKTFPQGDLLMTMTTNGLYYINQIKSRDPSYA